MKLVLTGWRGVAALSAVAVIGIGVGQAIAAQPHMAAALDALRTARAELIAAEPNKAGHRERAIRLVDSAIEEVRLGMAAAR